MAVIYDLPYELVTAIGAYLAAKWRCRLFMCCKMWYYTCSNNFIDQFNWHKRIFNVNNFICKEMYYNIYSDVYDDNDYLLVISKRIIGNKSPVFGRLLEFNITNSFFSGIVSTNVYSKFDREISIDMPIYYNVCRLEYMKCIVEYRYMQMRCKYPDDILDKIPYFLRWHTDIDFNDMMNFMSVYNPIKLPLHIAHYRGYYFQN